jgi:hypothetical protein
MIYDTTVTPTLEVYKATTFGLLTEETGKYKGEVPSDGVAFLSQSIQICSSVQIITR